MAIIERILLHTGDWLIRKIKSELAFSVLVVGLPAALAAAVLYDQFRHHQWRQYFGFIGAVFLMCLSCARAVRTGARYRDAQLRSGGGRLDSTARLRVSGVYAAACLLAAVSIIVVIFLFRLLVGNPL